MIAMIKEYIMNHCLQTIIQNHMDKRNLITGEDGNISTIFPVERSPKC